MENTLKVERISFQTAAQLIAALEKIAMPGIVSLDEMYVQDAEGVELDTLEVMQETLSDNSVVFNIVVFAEGDPNS
jgi:hypothetical protein